MGPFGFTVVGKKRTVTFECEHDGAGRVTFRTDATGEAEYEVDVRTDWEKEMWSRTLSLNAAIPSFKGVA